VIKTIEESMYLFSNKTKFVVIRDISVCELYDKDVVIILKNGREIHVPFNSYNDAKNALAGLVVKMHWQG
jgi:hypothetical protein